MEAIIIEHHPNDSRTGIAKDQSTIQTLTSRMGTGGGNVPLIMVEKPKAYTLKIRGGCERDANGRKAGKGALIQEELSATLGVSQDQYLFQPIRSIDERKQT